MAWGLTEIDAMIAKMPGGVAKDVLGEKLELMRHKLALGIFVEANVLVNACVMLSRDDRAVGLGFGCLFRVARADSLGALVACLPEGHDREFIEAEYSLSRASAIEAKVELPSEVAAAEAKAIEKWRSSPQYVEYLEDAKRLFAADVEAWVIEEAVLAKQEQKQ